SRTRNSFTLCCRLLFCLYPLSFFLFILLANLLRIVYPPTHHIKHISKTLILKSRKILPPAIAGSRINRYFFMQFLDIGLVCGKCFYQIAESIKLIKMVFGQQNVL